MNRYLIKFKKEGTIRFISHLDLMRVFQRAFKRADVRIEYSKGFSPHPKLSIAQPLSLGFSSTGEYLEVELEKTANEYRLIKILNDVMPAGLELVKCSSLDERTKSLAALVEYAKYDIAFSLKKKIELDYFRERLDAYTGEEHLNVTKVQKKSGKEKVMDIKSLIHSFDVISFDGLHCKVSCIIKTGSNDNLNPELFMKHFTGYIGQSIEKDEMTICRRELYTLIDQKLVPMEDLK